jgi:hypothetical protein
MPAYGVPRPLSVPPMPVWNVIAKEFSSAFRLWQRICDLWILTSDERDSQRKGWPKSEGP